MRFSRNVLALIAGLQSDRVRIESGRNHLECRIRVFSDLGMSDTDYWVSTDFGDVGCGFKKSDCNSGLGTDTSRVQTIPNRAVVCIFLP